MASSRRHVPYAQFQAEVRALLTKGRRITPRRASSWVKRYRKFVHLRWREGRPPCMVADHLFKYETQRVLAPRRDWERPEPGEIYETKRGDFWEVVGANDNRVDVRRAGHRVGSAQQLRWAKSVLKSLNEVKKKTLRTEAQAADEAAEFQALLAAKRTSSGSGSANDPGGRRRRRAHTARDVSPQYAELTYEEMLRGTAPKKRRAGKSTYPKKVKLTEAVKARALLNRRCPPGTFIQSVLFSRKVWSLPLAKKWLREHGMKTTPETTLKLYRFSQKTYNKKTMRVAGSREIREGLRLLFACQGKGRK